LESPFFLAFCRLVERLRAAGRIRHCAIEKQHKLVHPHLTRHGILVAHTIATKDGNIQKADRFFSAHGRFWFIQSCGG
jgi:hypothetical protein